MSGSNSGEPTNSKSSLGHAALPLIVSDAALQGSRYAFILYLGSQSLSDLGSFLMGGALGSLFGVAADFGISQHWLRLGVKDARLTRRTFTEVMVGKVMILLLATVLHVLLVIVGIWNVTTPLAMASGLLLMVLQALAESCEAVGLLFHRYAMVTQFRILLSLGVYAMPLTWGALLGQGHDSERIFVVLVTAVVAGLVLSLLYIWKVAAALHAEEKRGASYGEAWWNARWLGLNQLAVVTDVRAPLIILGVMLGETAVGLYGLVQRTTAVVELAWASLSRLLLTSYSELIGEQGVQKLRTQVVHAGRLTAWLMTGAAICLWGAALLIAKITALSSETTVALSLLQWAIVAIGLSSIKRPFVSGLIALYQERAICRVNMGVAAAGLILIPVLIAYVGIWGPVLGWVILEAVACVLIIQLFLSFAVRGEADLDPTLSQRVIL